MTSIFRGISALSSFTAAALTAGVLLSMSAGTASATVLSPDGRVCPQGGLRSFAGPGADIINSAGFPEPGTSVSVENQGLVIFRNPGSLQTSSCHFLSLTDSGGVTFENNSASTIENGAWLSMQSDYRVSVTGNSSLTNDGLVVQSSGTINVDAGSTLGGAGATVVSGGTLRVDGLMAQSLSGGPLVFQNGLIAQSGVTITGGRLEGSGTVQSDIDNTGGTVGPGNSPGTLTVDGDYTQGPGGTLAIEIDSLSSFDVLDVIGNVMLDGLLDLTVDAGYAAAAQVGDSFTIVEWDSFSGAFATVNGLNFAADKFFTLDYGTNGLTLTVNAATVVGVPEPGMIALFGLGLAGIGFVRWRRS